MIATGGCRGLIGPTRQFGSATIYHGYLWALPVGALLPVLFWWWQRRFPNTRLKYINTAVFLNGTTLIPPATGINYSSWFLVGFIFRESRLLLIDVADLGDQRLHRICYSQAQSPVVVQVQLHPQRSARLGDGAFPPLYLLHPSVIPGRRDPHLPQLVGKYCAVYEYVFLCNLLI